MVRAVLWAAGRFYWFFGHFRVSTVMTDGTSGNDRSKKPQSKLPADETALSERLTRLDQQLSDVRKSRKDQSSQSEDGQKNATASASAMARGFRLSSELVAGVVVGGVIGWGFDRLLSTSPWGLIVFFLLGFAAGVINVMRAAGVAPDRSLD